MPRPFTHPDLLILAVRAEKHLRRLRIVGELLQAGHCSLRKIAKQLKDHPDGFVISTLCKLPQCKELVALLLASFGRNIALYLNDAQDGLPVMGLSADGCEALRLTIEFLAYLDGRAQ